MATKLFLTRISEAITTLGGLLSLGETSATAYRGDRGKTAYDHSQLTTGNPHNVTAAQVGSPSGSGTSTGTNTGDETATTIRTKIGAASASNDGYLSSGDYRKLQVRHKSFTPHPSPLVSPAATPSRFCPFLITAYQTTALSSSTDTVMYMPFQVSEDMTVQRVGAYITASATGTIEIGVYSDSSDYPGTRLYTTGNAAISTSTTGIKEGTSVGLSLTKDTRYWLAVVRSAGSIKTIQAAVGVNVIQGFRQADLTTGTNYPIVGYTQSGTSLPSTAAVTGVISSYAPLLLLSKT